MEGKLSLFVDGDSVPTVIRAVILRRILKQQIPTIFAADRKLKDVQVASEEETARLRREAKAEGMADPKELKKLKGCLSYVVVPTGDGSADDWLVGHMTLPALAVTHDIPLAARLIEKGAVVLDDRGNIYDEHNIAPRLSERDINTQLREWGVQSEHTQRMDQRQLKAFSDAFDMTLQKLQR